VGLLGHTVLLTSNGAGTVSSVAVTILVGVTLRNGLTPGSAALEVDVVDVGTSVDNIDINALATIGGVQVLVERAEGKAVAVRDTSKTPGGVLLSLVLIGAESVNLLIILDELDLDENSTSVSRSLNGIVMGLVMDGASRATVVVA
jgi:hypothetical protein